MVIHYVHWWSLCHSKSAAMETISMCLSTYKYMRKLITGSWFDCKLQAWTTLLLLKTNNQPMCNWFSTSHHLQTDYWLIVGFWISNDSRNAVNSEHYIIILNESFFPEFDKIDAHDFYFQQDVASPHVSDYDHDWDHAI